VLGAGCFDLLQNLDYASPALDGIVEMKNEMRSVFQNDAARQLSLQCRTMRLQFINDARAIGRSENTNKDVRIF